MKRRFVVAAIAALALAAGCRSGDGSGPEQGDAGTGHDGPNLDGALSGDAAQRDGALQQDGAAGHTESMNGVMHMPGKEDPLTNCTACHGADLKGGTGPSCYTCHDKADHTINRGGYMHRAGATSSCNTCHGPNNTGGLGPACSTCH